MRAGDVDLAFSMLSETLTGCSEDLATMILRAAQEDSNKGMRKALTLVRRHLKLRKDVDRLREYWAEPVKPFIEHGVLYAKGESNTQEHAEESPPQVADEILKILRQTDSMALNSESLGQEPPPMEKLKAAVGDTAESPRLQAQLCPSLSNRSASSRRSVGIPRGTMRLPILESSIESGGSAPVNYVLNRVHEKIQHLLTDYDRLPSASNPNEPNWRLSARFLRKTMIMEGLLRNDSPAVCGRLQPRDERSMNAY